MAVGVIKWSQTAASNSNADSSINWAEGMAPSAVNDSARTTMASVAKWRDDLNATLVASGVSTGLTLTTNQVQGALTAGYEATFTTTFDIGSPATINVDTLGPKPLRRGPAVEMLAAQVKAGQPIRMSYFTSNSGEWIIQATRGITTVTQVFTVTASTYTPTSGMSYCIVEAAGGGGAGGTPEAGAGDSSAGGGGGGGAYTRAMISATQITSSQIVTVGAGGTASSSSSGADGGLSSLGSLVTAPGGAGGPKGSIDGNATGGAGGSTGNGDFSIAGQTGGAGCGLTDSSIIWGGAGGDSFFGHGGAAALKAGGAYGSGGSTGKDGAGYGAGGGGSAQHTSASGFAAGVGKQGVVIITEFI